MKDLWKWGWSVLLALSLSGLQAHAADKISVTINNQLITAYRTSDLESAKQAAVAAHKPIAWIASSPKLLDGRGNISLRNSRGATLHALFALRDRAVLVFMDAYEENHKVPQFIDDALHKPDPHYTPPTVLLLDPEAETVLATVTYEEDFVKRAKALARALDEAKNKPDRPERRVSLGFEHAESCGDTIVPWAFLANPKPIANRRSKNLQLVTKGILDGPGKVCSNLTGSPDRVTL